MEKTNKILSNDNKRFLKNVFVVIISNVFSAISGILIGFVVPKILSVGDYGYYKTFTLYSTYIGLLHFGFIDGIYLKFAGQSYENLDKEKFRTYTRVLMLVEGIFSLIGMSISLFFLNTATFFIFIFVGLNIFLTNMTSYFEFICQVTMRFKQRSARKIILCTLNILSVGVLYLLYKFANSEITGLLYIEITCLIAAIILGWYIITYRHIVFGKANSIKEEKSNLIFFIKTGILLLFATLVAQFIFAVDQQFINILFDEETYATYAFAYNMINVILIATSAISVVFFPTIKQMSKESLVERYPLINSYFLIAVSFCLISYYPLEFIVRFFLDKYIPSLPIFLIVLPGAVISSNITSIKYNCFKAFDMIKSFFFISLIILALSIGADAAVYFIFKEPKYLAIASIVMMTIWFLFAEIYFYKKFKTPWVKNFLYMMVVIGAFYGISFIGNIYIELGVFFAAYCLITYLFFFKLVNGFFRKLLNRKKQTEVEEEGVEEIEQSNESAEEKIEEAEEH